MPASSQPPPDSLRQAGDPSLRSGRSPRGSNRASLAACQLRRENVGWQLIECRALPTDLVSQQGAGDFQARGSVDGERLGTPEPGKIRAVLQTDGRRRGWTSSSGDAALPLAGEAERRRQGHGRGSGFQAPVPRDRIHVAASPRLATAFRRLDHQAEGTRRDCNATRVSHKPDPSAGFNRIPVWLRISLRVGGIRASCCRRMCVIGCRAIIWRGS